MERELAEMHGVGEAIAVSNGLDALRLTLRAWVQTGRLREGAEVIVAANTYIASVLAISDAGLKPVLVEPREDTLLLDPDRIEESITPRTGAIMEVHLYGQPCEHESVREIASRHSLLIIEDNAQAIGATYKGRLTGSLGNASAFSFYPTKNVGALGDAGAVLTSDAEVAAAVRALANYGSDRRYHNIYKGFNCRMDEIQAAMLRVKLRHMEQETRRRREIAEIYLNGIENPKVELPTIASGCGHVWHQFVVKTADRDDFRAYLSESGIGTDIHYATPPHLQPCYSGELGGPYPLTELLANQIVSLPIATVTPEEARLITRIINRWTGKKHS